VFTRRKTLEFQEIFSDQDCLEELCFSHIHKIIFGQVSLNLEDELKTDATDIDKVDSMGRTALSWAAQRADVASAQILLRYGANPNIYSAKNHSPLHYAAEARTPDCILPLLQHRADLHHLDREGQSALHYAAEQKDDLSYYRPLVEAGIDVDGMTIWKVTPMMCLVQNNRVDAARYLLDNGANVNLKGQDGKTPAYLAVEYNSHETLRLLYSRGADFSIENEADYGGPTIVHFAAQYGDTETIEILTEFKIRISGLYYLTPDGLTIPQVVQQRVDKNVMEGFGEAFAELLRSLELIDAVQQEGSGAEVEVDGKAAEEEFWDASEYLE
jgi:ankyrin repeat protein